MLVAANDEVMVNTRNFMRMKLNKVMCATCPWRDDSPYAYLRGELEESALGKASRICHSTGSNAINAHTGKPEALCRGARNSQLRFLTALGFLSEPTDQAWSDKCKRLGIKPDERKPK
jgi:hypothetical protein